MRKLLLSIAMIAMVSPAMALYSIDKPDCSKDSAYIEGLVHGGYEPIIKLNDKLGNYEYDIFYNTRTHITIIISADKSGKVCLVGTGSGGGIKGTLPTMRSFLDDIVKGE